MSFNPQTYRVCLDHGALEEDVADWLIDSINQFILLNNNATSVMTQSQPNTITLNNQFSSLDEGAALDLGQQNPGTFEEGAMMTDQEPEQILESNN